MKERGILFSGAMVRAILEGRKTQTRRVIKPQPVADERDPLSLVWEYARGRTRSYGAANGLIADCPYGGIGDRLWVRETLRRWGSQWVAYDAGNTPTADPNVLWRWRGDRCPSIHMPRELSRITLEIAEVRVQRLQDISDADVWAEGIESVSDPVGCFEELWDGINGKAHSWTSNPWVWAISFVRVSS